MNQSKNLHNNPLNSLKWNQNFKDINFEDNNYDADWAYTLYTVYTVRTAHRKICFFVNFSES